MFREAGFVLKGRETSVFIKVTCWRVDENENKSRWWSPVGVSFFRLLFSNAEIRERETVFQQFLLVKAQLHTTDYERLRWLT